MINKKTIERFEKTEVEILSAIQHNLDAKKEVFNSMQRETEKKNLVIELIVETLSKYPESTTAYLKGDFYNHLSKGVTADQFIIGVGRMLNFAIQKEERDALENFDGQYGTCTAPILNHFDLQQFESVDKYRHNNSVRYYPCPVNVANTLLDKLVNYGCNYEGYIFADIGSGMGRNLLIASNYPFDQIIGVEISKKLHEIAEENIKIYKEEKQQCKNFDLQNVDALNFEFPKTNMVLFFWEPFSDAVATPMMNKLEKLLRTIDKKVILVCCGEVFESVINSRMFKKKDAYVVNDLAGEPTKGTTQVAVYTNY